MYDIKEYLDANNINFREIKFDKIPITSKDVVNIYGCPLSQVLKTIIFIGKNIVIVVLQGDKKVNMKRLKLICKDKNMRMATPREIRDLFGKEIGCLDPFIRTPHCRRFLDSVIFDVDRVNMGSGIPDIGIEITTDELKKAWDGDIVQGISF
jgi:prolyl-tRNA editing enzyme YbaK/EbsC (Cys-tRNA(Pro) deacylase)